MITDTALQNGVGTKQQWPMPLRIAAQVVSVVFHPLFVPSFLTAYLLYIDQYAFAGMTDKLKLFRLISVVFATFFLPLFSVALMKQLGFVQSIMLRTQKDRIIPYIVCMIFYFWAWYVSKNLHDHPFHVAMLLSVFISSIGGMMMNIAYKVSMHAIAAGAQTVLFLWMAFNGAGAAQEFLPISILVTGLVCTARFIVSDHTGFEVYSGLLLGALCQLVAAAIAG